MSRDYLSVMDLSAGETREVLALAMRLKGERSRSVGPRSLAGKTVAMLFEKPSLRTRVSIEVAIHELGGHPLYLGPDEVGLGKREAVGDVGRVLSSYVHMIVARVFKHRDLETMARTSSVPVINALSDQEHPCQALADLLTLQERRGGLSDSHIAFIGDSSNNVAISLMLLAARLGVAVTLVGPPGYQPSAESVERARREPGARISIASNVADAELSHVDAIYTDVWVSMGHEHEAERHKRALCEFQVDRTLLTLARPEAIFLHCLPAKRGEEVTDEVIDGPRSAVWDQAENRLHAQKALLVWLTEQG